MALSPYRIVLLAAIFPTLAVWLSGKAGKILASDILIFLFALWPALSLSVVHGLEQSIEPAGIFFIETFGSYLLARCFIRQASQFATMVHIYFWSIVILLPFAFYESMTSTPIILKLLSNFASAYSDAQSSPRLGFERAQVVFQHSILFGVFCAGSFSLTYFIIGYKKSSVARIIRCSLIAVTSAFSVSSGAITAIVLQAMFISWESLTHKINQRWKILAGFGIAAYIIVDLISNRSPFRVFVNYLTLNPATGYHRLLIWDYGSAEVLRHPWFGIGNNDWVRPFWMGPSMDNFWLFTTVSYGLPAFLFFAGGIFLILRGLVKVKTENEQTQAYALGLFITLVGLIFAGMTVHFWNAVYSLFLFLLGSGVWVLDQKKDSVSVSSPDHRARGKSSIRLKKSNRPYKPIVQSAGIAPTRRGLNK